MNIINTICAKKVSIIHGVLAAFLINHMDQTLNISNKLNQYTTTRNRSVKDFFVCLSTEFFPYLH